MEGKDIDRFVKGSIDEVSGTPHPDQPDHDENWALLESELEEQPKRRRPFLYVAAAALALLLFSNFYWMLEQRTYKAEISAIVLEYEEKLAKEPPAPQKAEPAPEPTTAPSPEPVPSPGQTPSIPEPEVKVVYVDRIVEVPVEVPVYIEVEKPIVAETLPSSEPTLQEAEEPVRPTIENTEHRKDLIPQSKPAESKKKKNKKNESQRSFGLKLALNQK